MAVPDRRVAWGSPNQLSVGQQEQDWAVKWDDGGLWLSLSRLPCGIRHCMKAVEVLGIFRGTGRQVSCPSCCLNVRCANNSTNRKMSTCETCCGSLPRK